MRSMKECQAEVFCRSRNRIKARRKKAVLTCIPLIVCVVLLSGVALMDRHQAPEASGAPDGAAGVWQEYSYESAASQVTRIEVSGSGATLVVTDATRIQKISHQLNLRMTKVPEINGSVVGEFVQETVGGMRAEDMESAYLGTADSANVWYTVVLVTDMGDKTEYRLFGCTLINMTTDETYLLPQEEMSVLLELLGISNP